MTLEKQWHSGKRGLIAGNKSLRKRTQRMAAGADTAQDSSLTQVPVAERPRRASVRVLLLFLVLSTALNYACLSGGFVLDDIAGVSFLRQHAAPQISWLRLWSSSMDQTPVYQEFWWSDPGAKLAFFRPLPSVLLAMCYWAFGENGLAFHLLLILLHGMAAFTVFLLFAALAGDLLTAFVAGLLFVASGRVTTVGWIAAIPDMSCVIFFNLALLAHVHWRRKARPLLLAASLLSLMLALVSKESAAVAPLAIVMLEWILGRSEGSSFASVVRRATPSLAVLLVFIGAYRLLHLGESDNLLYLSPFTQPVLYLHNAVLAVPVLLASALTVIHARPLTASVAAVTKRVVLGGAAELLLLWGLRHLWREAPVRWAMACFIVLLLPQAATEPADRLLYGPFVPLSLLLARLIVVVLPRHCSEKADAPMTPALASRRPPLITRAWGVYALFGLSLPGLILSVRSTKPRLAGLREPERKVQASVRLVNAAMQRRPDTTVVILNTGGPEPDTYAGASYAYLLRRAVPTRVLVGLDGRLTLMRTGERSFTISTDQCGWLENQMSRRFRRNLPLFVGRAYRTPLFDAKILQLTPDGKDALSVAFTFHRPLDDAGLLFLSWNGRNIAPFDLAGTALYQPVSLNPAPPPGQKRLGTARLRQLLNY